MKKSKPPREPEILGSELYEVTFGEEGELETYRNIDSIKDAKDGLPVLRVRNEFDGNRQVTRKTWVRQTKALLLRLERQHAEGERSILPILADLIRRIEQIPAQPLVETEEEGGKKTSIHPLELQKQDVAHSINEARRALDSGNADWSAVAGFRLGEQVERLLAFDGRDLGLKGLSFSRPPKARNRPTKAPAFREWLRKFAAKKHLSYGRKLTNATLRREVNVFIDSGGSESEVVREVDRYKHIDDEEYVAWRSLDKENSSTLKRLNQGAD